MHLVVFAGENQWPAIQAVSHWSSCNRPITRVHLVEVGRAAGLAARVRGLERWMRDALPAAEVSLAECAARPEAVAELVDDLLKSQPAAPQSVAPPEPPPVPTESGTVEEVAAGASVTPDAGNGASPDTGIAVGPAPVVLEISGLPAPAALGLAGFVGRDGVLVVGRAVDGVWQTFDRDESGSLRATEFAEIRREATDGVSIPPLVRAQFGKSECRFRFVTLFGQPTSEVAASPEAAAFPLAALTQAGIRTGWRWKEAFEAVGIALPPARPSEYLAHYLEALLRSLGVTNVVQGSFQEPAAAGGAQGLATTLLWLSHGGRLTLLDLGGAEPAETTPGAERPLLGEILAAASRLQPLGGLPVSVLMIRPGGRLSEAEREVAAARGVRMLEERDCHELPERLGQVLGIPMNAETAEVARLVRVHLAESGRARVFTEEAWVVREQTAGGGDPVLADVDAWLGRIQIVRGQNWMAWTHRHRIWIRVPAEQGRSDTVSEWRLVIAMVLGQDPEHVRAVLRDDAVWLDMADQSEVRRRASAWFRPFLNAPITFAAAQGRFAAEARIQGEAPVTMPAKPAAPAAAGPARPAAPRPPSRPAPPRRGPSPDRGRPAPGPGGRGGSGGGGGLGSVGGAGLEDLDRALDGLGG